MVTVDDAMDVVVNEATEDITIMAAVNPSEKTYFETSIFVHAKNRFVWLLVLMLSATVTGTIITHYEDAFAAIPILVSFIPMLMDTGGNCGSQSSTLIIRGLALANGIRIYLMYKNLQLAFVIGISLIATVIIAKMIGCTLPLFAKKIHLDPAIMAAPLITTLVDTCSIIIYFTIATHVFSL